jgi:carbon starvation protein
VPALRRTESWTANLIATAGCVAMWGLYQGVIDPLGGINTLWPLFGISNQMLAGIALMLGTVVLIKMKRQRYVWVAVACRVAADLHHHRRLHQAVRRQPGDRLPACARSTAMRWPRAVLAPAKDITQMQHVIFNATPTQH